MRELPPELGEITARLVAAFEAVYLCGAYFWGEPDEDSDLDLLVVVADSDAAPAQRTTRVHRTRRGVHPPKVIPVKTQAETTELLTPYRARHPDKLAEPTPEKR